MGTRPPAELCCPSPAQPGCFGPLHTSTQPVSVPGSPWCSPGVSGSSSLLPTISTITPGRKHVFKHVRASLSPPPSPLW